MQRVKPPDKLPGDFALLVFDRLSEAYTLQTDDPDLSSYALGMDTLGAIQYFRRVGEHELIADSVVDFARRFGAAQLIFEGSRVIPIFEKRKPELKFKEEADGQTPTYL